MRRVQEDQGGLRLERKLVTISPAGNFWRKCSGRLDHMRRYHNFLEWVRLLALFSAVFLADVVLRLLEQVHAAHYVSVLVLGFCAIAVFHVTELLVTTLFERLTWLRRWVLGDEWVEGVWFDAVQGRDLFGIITIQQKEGSATVVGEQFDANGKVTATWENFVVLIEGNTMRAIYRAPQFNGAAPSELLGFTTYVFSGMPDKPPSFYNGYFADMSQDARKCQLRGYRIKDRQILKRLRDPQAKQATLLELIERYRTGLGAAEAPTAERTNVVAQR